MIQEFSKANLQQIRSELNEVLDNYGKKYGMTLNIGNITFSAGDFSTKLTAKINGAKTQADAIFEHQMSRHKLQKNGIGGRELIGYNARSYAYPFRYIQNGRTYKCSAVQAQVYFSTSRIV